MRTTASQKEATRARIVDKAALAIRQHGFDGAGVAGIMKAAGLTHGGFYAHFPSRDALVAEAMDRAGEDSLQTLTAAVARRRARGASPFRALVSSYLGEEHLAADAGCPVAALVSDAPRQPDAVQAAARRRVLSLVETVRAHLPPKVASEEAEVIASTMVGALQLARALGPDRLGKAFLATHREQLLSRYDT